MTYTRMLNEPELAQSDEAFSSNLATDKKQAC
jgi:hypothetical protein